MTTTETLGKETTCSAFRSLPWDWPLVVERGICDRPDRKVLFSNVVFTRIYSTIGVNGEEVRVIDITG